MRNPRKVYTGKPKLRKPIKRYFVAREGTTIISMRCNSLKRAKKFADEMTTDERTYYVFEEGYYV